MLDLKEEIKQLKSRGPNNLPSLLKIAKMTAVALDQAASQAAFVLFHNKKFRQLIKFSNLEKIEQDRIFNELVVSNLALLMLVLESPDLNIPDQVKEYFLLIKEKIPKVHVEELAQLGIERKYLQDWQKLINMRYEEYDQDKLEARKAAIEIETKEKELTQKGLEKIQLLLPLQTVAIGCHHHLCRGKTKDKNELFKLIFHDLGKFYVEIRVRLEGGEITFLHKVKAKIRHFWNFIKA